MLVNIQFSMNHMSNDMLTQSLPTMKYMYNMYIYFEKKYKYHIYIQIYVYIKYV